MTTRRKSSVLCFLAVLLTSTYAAAEPQRTATPLSEEKAIHSEDWLTRRTAFLSLIGISSGEWPHGM